MSPERAPSSNPADTWTISSGDAEVCATRINGSRWRLTTRSRRGALVPRTSCETSFPRELIELLATTTAPEWICDAIARHEDPTYVQQVLRQQLFSYFPGNAFAGKRMLDFGCGNGASTMIMASLLPHTEVIGVELDATHIAEANAILAHRKLANVRFLQSPSGESLPEGIGSFDFIMLSAVFEHLLPPERRTVMPLLWSHLAVGGVLFVNQTPHRWHPYEHHSTGLWGINYLPRSFARWVASRYGVGTRSRTWEEMLRGGIRGGSERSIRAALTGGRTDDAEVMQPSQNGLRSRGQYWLACTSPRRREAKRLIAALFGVCDSLIGTIPALNVDVVIRKVR
jgi:SAM-dependent methyltransferase